MHATRASFSPYSARYVCKTVFIAIILVNLFSTRAGAFSNLALMLLMTIGTLQVPPYLHQGLGITLVACRAFILWSMIIAVAVVHVRPLPPLYCAMGENIDFGCLIAATPRRA